MQYLWMFGLALVILCTEIGCSLSKKVQKPEDVWLMPGKLTFRSHHFGSKIDEVRSKENMTPFDAGKDFLRYRWQPDSSRAQDMIEIQYYFNKRGQLDMIMTDYSMADVPYMKSTLNRIIAYLDRQFSAHYQDELGWYNWNWEGESHHPGTVEILLQMDTTSGFSGLHMEWVKYYQKP